MIPKIMNIYGHVSIRGDIMLKKEYEEISKNDVAYRIEYETPYSRGVIEIDSKVYLKKINKFRKAFKDATIIKMEEVKKPENHSVQVGRFIHEGRYI